MRDWLDEQMDEADLRHEAEELRRDGIEANLSDSVTEEALTFHIEQSTPADYRDTALGALDALDQKGELMTAARTVETNFADALARLLLYIGDSDNLGSTWGPQFERSFPSVIVDVDTYADAFAINPGESGVIVRFEDGSVLHLTVTQIKESNQ